MAPSLVQCISSYSSQMKSPLRWEMGEIYAKSHDTVIFPNNDVLPHMITKTLTGLNWNEQPIPLQSMYTIPSDLHWIHSRTYSPSKQRYKPRSSIWSLFVRFVKLVLTFTGEISIDIYWFTYPYTHTNIKSNRNYSKIALWKFIYVLLAFSCTLFCDRNV